MVGFIILPYDLISTNMISSLLWSLYIIALKGIYDKSFFFFFFFTQIRDGYKDYNTK
jgi:hypothetical protein